MKPEELGTPTPRAIDRDSRMSQDLSLVEALASDMLLSEETLDTTPLQEAHEPVHPFRELSPKPTKHLVNDVLGHADDNVLVELQEGGRVCMLSVKQAAASYTDWVGGSSCVGSISWE